jgi:LL-diaminopimelate aminotransferase
MPGGTCFLYAASPKAIAGGPTFANAEACSQYLITEHSICTVPWDDAGSYLRFSVTYEALDAEAENALMVQLEERLKGLKFVF